MSSIYLEYSFSVNGSAGHKTVGKSARISRALCVPFEPRITELVKAGCTVQLVYLSFRISDSFVIFHLTSVIRTCPLVFILQLLHLLPLDLFSQKAGYISERGS